VSIHFEDIVRALIFHEYKKLNMKSINKGLEVIESLSFSYDENISCLDITLLLPI
jgi:hypothetical protein